MTYQQRSIVWQNPASEYLVYVPDGGKMTVDLSAAKESLAVEWFNPTTGEKQSGDKMDGGMEREFRVPFDGDAVLNLSQE